MAMQAVQPQPNIRLEMKRHREELKAKRAVHPGVTQRDAGFTPEERERLACGVLSSITERGERWANWALVILAGALLLAIGVGMVTDRWAEKKQMQTVEAGR